MILPRCKAIYTQEIGEPDADPSCPCERLFQCEQTREPVLGALATPLEILWTDLEQYYFSERNIWLLHRCECFLGLHSFPTRSFMSTNSPSIDLVSIF
jgi:hypothetical protein